MKILLVPLDERPCNYYFPQMLKNEKCDIIVPPKEILGNKKQPASISQLQEFVLNHIKECDAAVLSMDMLLYGGLIPSRLHHLSQENLISHLSLLDQLKEIKKDIKIYAFQCIMRCPQYDSSEEEPDYYEDYGYALFRKKYLEDKKNRETLSTKEEEEYQNISIPLDIVQDYEERRHKNLLMNRYALKYIQDNIIDFYVIPQDDSALYGYTALDQKTVLADIKKEHLQLKTMVYPGADEVAMSLITRAYNEYYQKTPRIYPFYASVLGPTIIPRYEDRPMYESLKSHIRVTNAKITNHIQEADIVLAINCPGKIMQESFDNQKDVTYSSYRELLTFSYQMKDYLEQGYPVALCDSAYSNGGDLELLSFLDELDILDKLSAYAGWNTNCNTLGTVLAQCQIQEKRPVHNIIYRMIEDGFYQAKVRRDIIENDLVELDLGYYDFKDKQNVVEERISKALLNHYYQYQISKKYPIESLKIDMPWKRMFEIGMAIKWK